MTYTLKSFETGNHACTLVERSDLLVVQSFKHYYTQILLYQAFG